MKEEDIVRVTRWIDGDLTDTDIQDLLEADPSLREEKQAARAVSQEIRAEIPQELQVPFPEVFHRQIFRRIEEERHQSVWGRMHGFFSWLTVSEWGLPMAASATLLALLTAGLQWQGGASPFQSRVVHIFTPNPAHVARTELEGGVTVIELQGLAPLPDTVQVMGYFPTESRRNPLLAGTTFYEGEIPRLLLSMNALGEPRLQSFR